MLKKHFFNPLRRSMSASTVIRDRFTLGIVISGAKRYNCEALGRKAIAVRWALPTSWRPPASTVWPGRLNVLAAIAGRGAGFKILKDTWADTTTPRGRTPCSNPCTRRHKRIAGRDACFDGWRHIVSGKEPVLARPTAAPASESRASRKGSGRATTGRQCRASWPSFD